MHSLLKAIFINLIAFFIIAAYFPGLYLDSNLKTLFLAALTFTLINKLIKPIIKLLLLPINIITLGLFRWVASVATLFLLTSLIPGVAIVSFVFARTEIGGFIAPQMQVSILASYILTAIALYLVTATVRWLVKS